MQATGLIQDQRFQTHDTGPNHPERPERLVAVAEALRRDEMDRACVSLAASPVNMERVRRVHNDVYIDRLSCACADGKPFIDVPDSAINSASFEIAKLAAGAVVSAVDAVMNGRIKNAFCAVRPPGHHAERDVSMGFCLFNSVAIAATHLIENHGLSRVLILDWDVHHGNGTQHAFESDPRVLFVSLHGHPGVVYPGTGFETERGIDPGEGFTINVPMIPPSSDIAWQRAFDQPVLPAIQRFQPEFVLISAGFDAHQRDPLAPLDLSTEVFGWMTDRLIEVAREHCDGRLVSVLEGGYDLVALAECTSLHVSRLLEA